MNCLPYLPTGKYFSTQELAKLKIPNQFNIFHTNINDLNDINDINDTS